MEKGVDVSTVRQSSLEARDWELADSYASFGNRNDGTVIERFRVMSDDIVEVHVDLFGAHAPQTKDNDTG